MGTSRRPTASAAGAQPADGKPVLALPGRREWEQWLRKHQGTSKGVWLRLAKKGASESTIAYSEAVEAALCYGWIDGQAKSGGTQYWFVTFTPRGPRSIWSKRNRDKALALIASGRMKAAGLAEVRRAQADGRWEAAYDSPSRIVVPEDLRAALGRNSRAKRAFGKLDARNRYAILFRIHNARRARTRATRIAAFVGMLARGETIHPRSSTSSARRR